MSPRRSLPLLLLSLLCSSLLEASSAGEEEGRQEQARPLMILKSVGMEKPGSDNKLSERDQREIDCADEHLDPSHVTEREEKESDLSSIQPQENLSGLGAENSSPNNRLRDVTNIFANHYSRTDEIAKKKSRYEEELQLLDPTSARVELIRNHLLPLLDKATTYQITINKHLLDQINKEGVPPVYKVTILQQLIQINDHPNKIERFVNEIEIDHQRLTQAQAKAQEIIAEIEAFRDIPTDLLLALPYQLNNAQKCINKSIYLRDQLCLTLRTKNSAGFIKPPYEPIDAATREAMVLNQQTIIRSVTIAQINFRIASNWLDQYQYDKLKNLIQNELDLGRAKEVALVIAAQEADKEQLRKELIELYLDSAELHQQAEATLDNIDDPNKEERSTYLYSKLN